MAALPLLVCFIDQYSRGLVLIKKWMGYKHNLTQLRRDIKIQKLLYESTFYKLFENVLGKNSPTLDKLLCNLSGELWDDPEISQRFKTALGAEDWKLFEDVIKGIYTLFNGIKDQLEKELPTEMRNLQQAFQKQPQAIQNQPQATQNQLQDARNQPQAIHDNPGRSRTRDYLTALAARFRYTFSDDQEVSMDALENLIKSFHKLTARRVEVSLRRSEQLRRRVATEFKDVRKGALNLFEAINSGFTCTCTPKHQAVLNLKTSFEPVHIAFCEGRQFQQIEHYNILFRSQSSWKATKIAPRSHQEAVAICSRIDNLCVKLQQPENSHPPPCLGYLATNTRVPNEQKSYCLDPSTTTISDE